MLVDIFGLVLHIYGLVMRIFGLLMHILMLVVDIFDLVTHSLMLAVDILAGDDFVVNDVISSNILYDVRIYFFYLKPASSVNT